jgi:CBS domain-containing protein
MLKVSDVLRTKSNNIWSISSQSTVFRALQIMADKDIGALLVIEEGKLVGVFSERDYARKVILKGKSSKETMVRELMTTPVFAVTKGKTIEECMALMTVTRHRHMPVIEDGKLIGIVSLGDVVKAIISQQKIMIHDLENFIIGGDFMHSL